MCSQFVDVELIVDLDGETGADGSDDIACIEVNSRMFSQFADTYRQTLTPETGDCYAALLHTLLAPVEQPPPAPESNGLFGLNGYVYTTIEGPAEDSVDFAAADELAHQGLHLLVSPGDHVKCGGWGGMGLLGYLNLSAESPLDIHDEFVAVHRAILTPEAVAANPTLQDSTAMRRQLETQIEMMRL